MRPTPWFRPGVPLVIHTDTPLRLMSVETDALANVLHQDGQERPAAVLPTPPASAPEIRSVPSAAVEILQEPECMLLAVDRHGGEAVAGAFVVRDRRVSFFLVYDEMNAAVSDAFELDDLVASIRTDIGERDAPGEATTLDPLLPGVLASLHEAGLSVDTPIARQALDELLVAKGFPFPVDELLDLLRADGIVTAQEGGMIAVSPSFRRWWSAFDGKALELAVHDIDPSGHPLPGVSTGLLFLGRRGARIHAHRVDEPSEGTQLLELSGQHVSQLVKALLLDFEVDVNLASAPDRLSSRR